LQSSGKYDKDIATQIKPAGNFYMAEDYHQQYIEKKRLSSEVIS
jgi:peptide-methionine (S)-S-oxide reductase